MRRSKRQRRETHPRLIDIEAPDTNFEPIIKTDRRSWTGWCEIESEPAFFNTMLSQMGVRNVKVREVVSLDDDILQSLPRPVYGFIFLFKWIDGDGSVNDKDETSSTIWFANQTVSNACATIALLNILNNIPGIDLGEHLSHFKTFTYDLPPVLRGDAVAQFEFVRQIHNSFAREMDMLNSDLQMKNDAKSSINRSRKRKPSDEESNFHFNAYVPIDGKVLKLDGLDTSPRHIGDIENDDWLSLIRNNLATRMSSYEGFTEFAIMALVQDPIIQFKDSLAENVKCLQALKLRLEELDSKWITLVSNDSGGELAGDGFPSTVLLGPDASYGLLSTHISDAKVPAYIETVLEDSTLGPLLSVRKDLIQMQHHLRLSIKNEEYSELVDKEKSESRRHDFAPAIEAWLRAHSRKGIVKDFLM